MDDSRSQAAGQRNSLAKINQQLTLLQHTTLFRVPGRFLIPLPLDGVSTTPVLPQQDDIGAYLHPTLLRYNYYISTSTLFRILSGVSHYFVQHWPKCRHIFPLP